MKTNFQLPQVVIEVDGLALEAQLVQSLEEVRVAQKLSLPAQCELTFQNPAAGLDASRRLGIGSKLRVALRGEAEALFSGEITALEYTYGPANAPTLHVRGYDLLHRLRKRQSVRAHVQETLPNLARELLADLGITIRAEDNAWPEWKRIIQYRQSDLELLTEVAGRCGVYFSLWENEMHIISLKGSGSPLALRLGDNLFEARLEVNSDSACRTVLAEGWDPLVVEPHSASATEARSGRQVAAAAPASRFGETGRRSLADELTGDERQAQALAQAELDTRTAREVTFWGAADGDALLRPGRVVDVTGVEGSLTGQYVLTSVTHLINQRSGFTSEVSSEPPALPARPRSSIVALGEVTSVADPEKIGRVQVKLPTYNNVETEWMGVLCNAAGPDKGLIMLPDVGDLVLVLFPREDLAPGGGIVLGGVYGLKGPPDSGVEEDSVQRYTFLTEGGQKIVLDDGRQSIHLEDKTGSTLDLSPSRVKLHAAVNLVLEAPGKSVVIRGQSIDFERG